MIVAGFGCKKGASVASLEAAFAEALANAGLDREQIGAIATHDTKSGEPGLIGIAANLALPLLVFTTADMRDVEAGIETMSDRVVELKGVPSVAEGAALAAAGFGGRLLGPRVTTQDAACALAEGQGPRESQP